MLLTSFSHLGLTTDATVREVKLAYRARAAVLHPDHGGNVDAFTALNEAYNEALLFAETAPCTQCVGGERSTVGPGFKVTRSLCPTCHGTGRRG